MRVTLANLGHRYGHNNWLFQNLTAELLPGEVYALTGPSGAGKSTLLHLIAGWEKPAAGNVMLHNIERINWVFQNPHGSARRSALDHVVFPLLAAGMPRREAEFHAIELLAKFKLSDCIQKEFRYLSGGEAQRLMLARAYATQAHLYLIDEPTAQLDMRTSLEINTVIKNMATNNCIIVIATHDMETQRACTQHINLAKYQRN